MDTNKHESEVVEIIRAWKIVDASSPRPSPPFGMEERVPAGRERRRSFPASDTSALSAGGSNSCFFVFIRGSFHRAA
jgi:hypothetical protein